MYFTTCKSLLSIHIQVVRNVSLFLVPAIWKTVPIFPKFGVCCHYIRISSILQRTQSPDSLIIFFGIFSTNYFKWIPMKLHKFKVLLIIFVYSNVSANYIHFFPVNFPGNSSSLFHLPPFLFRLKKSVSFDASSIHLNL